MTIHEQVNYEVTAVIGAAAGVISAIGTGIARYAGMTEAAHWGGLVVFLSFTVSIIAGLAILAAHSPVESCRGCKALESPDDLSAGLCERCRR